MTRFSKEEEQQSGVLGILACIFMLIAGCIVLFGGGELVALGIFFIGLGLFLPVLRVLYEQEQR